MQTCHGEADLPVIFSYYQVGPHIPHDLVLPPSLPCPPSCVPLKLGTEDIQFLPSTSSSHLQMATVFAQKTF